MKHKILFVGLIGLMLSGCMATDAQRATIALSSGDAQLGSLLSSKREQIAKSIQRQPSQANKELAKSRGFENADKKLKATLARLLTSSSFPANSVTVGIYSCDAGTAEAIIEAKRIRVCRSVLPRLRTEDELAFLLAHEAAHVLLAHDRSRETAIAAEANQAANTRRTIMAPVVVAAMIATGGMAGLGVGAAYALMDNAMLANEVEGGKQSYSREVENEADLLGLELMVKAGFNPTGAVKFFDSIGAEAETEVADRRVNWNSLLAGFSNDSPSGGAEFLQSLADRASQSSINRRSHPHVDSRMKIVASLISRQYSDTASRIMKPVDFSNEYRSARSALTSGAWPDDSNYALARSWLFLKSKQLPEAIKALERVPANTASEGVLRNLLILNLFSGDKTATGKAAERWVSNAGLNSLVDRDVQLLLVADQTELALKIADFRCRRTSGGQANCGTKTIEGWRSQIEYRARNGEAVGQQAAARLAKPN